MTAEHPRRFGRFSLEPKDVARVETRHRRITTPLPVPASLPILEKLLRHEPPSMACQPPVLWHRAEGSSVHDRFGNTWIDFSSSVLVANAGHAHPRVLARIQELAARGHLAAYVFPHEERAEVLLVRRGDRGHRARSYFERAIVSQSIARKRCPAIRFMSCWKSARMSDRGKSL